VGRHKNLKVTFGLRLDRTGNPLCVDDCFSRLTAPFTSSSFQKGADIPYNQSIQTGLSNAYYSVDSVVPQPRVRRSLEPQGWRQLHRGPRRLRALRRSGPGLPDLQPVQQRSLSVHGGLSITARKWAPPATRTAPPRRQNEFNAFKTGFFGGQTLAQLNNSVPADSAPSAISPSAALQHSASMPSGVSKSSSPSEKKCFGGYLQRKSRIQPAGAKWFRQRRGSRAVLSPACRRPARSPLPQRSPSSQPGHIELRRRDLPVPPRLLARLPGPDQLHLEPRLGRRVQRRLRPAVSATIPAHPNTLANPNIKELWQRRLRYAPQRDRRFRLRHALEVQQPRPQLPVGQLVALEQALCPHR
jgi:hypothetical protein